MGADLRGLVRVKGASSQLQMEAGIDSTWQDYTGVHIQQGWLLPGEPLIKASPEVYVTFIG